MSESWKTSPIVFQRQLELNLEYFKPGGVYPNHWYAFLAIMRLHADNLHIRNILDIGCGCGACYELCRKEFPGMTYIGIDFAEHAINTARAHWKVDQFFVRDFWKLQDMDLETFDLIYCDGLLEVMGNADEALRYLVSLRPRIAILNRVSTHQGNNTVRTYKAYDEIDVYGFTHNYEQFLKIIEDANYEWEHTGSTFLIRRPDVQAGS